MARKNNRIERLKRIVNDLKEKVKSLSDLLKSKDDKFHRGKLEHNAALLLINDLGGNLPTGWTRHYDHDHQRFCYSHSTKDLRFWSASISLPENHLEDIHPNDFDSLSELSS